MDGESGYLADTAASPHAFFRPHTRASLPLEPGSPSGESDASGRVLFVSRAGLEAWALERGLPVREAMARLLPLHIWPERFRRSYGLLAAQDMARLLRSRVFVLGCGGLGGHVAELLARTGVGCLRLADHDVFDESNLNRQRFCTERVLGLPKVEVVGSALADMASHLEVEALRLRADAHNLPDLLHGMDAALDCLDSLADKAALERAALAAGTPFVHGAVLRDEGFAYAASGPPARLPQLYPEGQSRRDLALAAQQATGALAPAALACLMVRLCLRVLLAPKGGEAGGQAAHSPLYHVDLSVPELERFSWLD